MLTLKFAVLAGDYIGPEVMAEALRVLAHVAKQENLTLAYTAGTSAAPASTTTAKPFPNPREALRGVRCHSLRLRRRTEVEKLPPKEQPERAALLPLRKHFTLFANIRPGLLYPELTDASPLRARGFPMASTSCASGN